jgi:Thiamine pyrophosphate enzyme, C-terminal TPP binding domain
VVRLALPPDGILSFDVGAHTHQIASQWTAHAPMTFHITNGWSSMGFGLPGAIAAKLARSDLPVVCLIGDGCFQMTCGEVAVAKRLGLVLPIVVLDDRWLALIKVKQIRRQFPLYGTALQEEDYREPPAHYFGVPAQRGTFRRCARRGSGGGARRRWPDGDRGGGRFRSLRGHGLRLSASPPWSATSRRNRRAGPCEDRPERPGTRSDRTGYR